ncbi:unnamed protein product, partial [Gulo gulo]
MTQMLRLPGRMLMRTWNPRRRRGLQSHPRSLQSEGLGFCGLQRPRSHVPSRLPWGTRVGGTLSQGQRHCRQPPEGVPHSPGAVGPLHRPDPECSTSPRQKEGQTDRLPLLGRKTVAEPEEECGWQGN